MVKIGKKFSQIMIGILGRGKIVKHGENVNKT
jgi:hypothetical protein